MKVKWPFCVIKKYNAWLFFVFDEVGLEIHRSNSDSNWSLQLEVVVSFMLAYGQSGFRCQSRCPDNANTDYLNCTAHCMSFRCRQSRDGQIAAAAKVIAQ